MANHWWRSRRSSPIGPRSDRRSTGMASSARRIARRADARYRRRMRPSSSSPIRRSSSRNSANQRIGTCHGLWWTNEVACGSRRRWRASCRRARRASFFGTIVSHSSIGSEPRNASIASRTRNRSRWGERYVRPSITRTSACSPSAGARSPSPSAVTRSAYRRSRGRRSTRWTRYSSQWSCSSRSMVIARRLDRECIALQRQGELTVYPGFEGQEAAQVGSALALGPLDFVWPTFRELAVALVRGVDAVQYLQYHRGTWHGGPYDPRATRFGPICIPIATQLPHAAGYALGQRLDEI